MTQNRQPAAPQPEPILFSLGTMFLTVTCFGVVLAGYRFAGGNLALGTAVAALSTGGFLAVWFSATRQFKRLPVPALLVAFGLAGFALASRAMVVSRYHSGIDRGSRLEQIGWALLTYQNAFGKFPPAVVTDAGGKPLYSWRAMILPYVGHQYLFGQIHRDEPWNGPNNAKATQTHVAAFDFSDDSDSTGSTSDLTHILAVVGPHTAWPGTKAAKLSDFKDPSKTILLVEVANSDIHWAEPRDLNIDKMPLAINSPTGKGISSDDPGGAYVLFADGHTEFLPNSTDPKKLAVMLDIDGCNDPAAIDGDK